MKAPEKIYLYPYATDRIYEVETKPLEGTIEYIRADAFIEKACEFWKDHLDGYDICEDDIERSVESFKLAMKI